MIDSLKLWSPEGLRFKCTGCGKCCSGTPGYVWVNKQEIQDMAAFLQISEETFLKKYTRQVGNRIALLEVKKGQNFDCIFLKDKACSLYSVRPTQCRTYPWWKENISSKEGWEEAAQICEGINHPEGALFSPEEIESKA